MEEARPTAAGLSEMRSVLDEAVIHRDVGVTDWRPDALIQMKPVPVSNQGPGLDRRPPLTRHAREHRDGGHRHALILVRQDPVGRNASDTHSTQSRVPVERRAAMPGTWNRYPAVRRRPLPD